MNLLQRILSKSGKYGDEVLEGADEVSEASILRNMSDEAADLTQPLGSGKNLQALQDEADFIKAKNQIELQDMQKNAANAPFEENIADLNKQNLGLSYGTGGKSYDDVASGIVESKAAAPTLADIAEQLGTKDASKVTSMDAIRELIKNNPKKSAAAGAAIGGTLYNSMLGDSQTIQPPMAPQAKMPVEAPADEEEEEINPEIMKLLGEEPKGVAGSEKSQTSLSQKMEQPSVEPKEIDYSQLMMGAQKGASDNEFRNAMLRAGTQAGAAIAGLGAGAQVKGDYTMADSLDKTARRPVEDVKGLMETKSAESKMKQFEREMNDEQKLRDPNSSASKITRDVLARHGLSVKTAKEAKDAGINVQNILLQEMAHKKALEVAEKTLEGKEKSQKDKEKKFIQGLRKEATTGVLGKQYATYSTGQRMASALSEFAKNPSGYKDYATLMGGLKTLQGDESVVRESEIRLGMDATSAINKVSNYIQRLSNGQSLQPEQRKEMINTITILTEASKKQYMQSVQPILEQAQQEGIDPNLILSGSLSGAKSGESQELTTDSGKMVKVQRISDGATKLLPAASAAKMDTSKYKILD